MQTLNKINTTHCKVQCGNEFRRFLLPSAQYLSLENQIRDTFGFGAEKNLVIKYTDEEGDMVTISSDEELAFAITLFAGGLLRLTICGPKGGCRNRSEQQDGCGDKKWDKNHKWENQGSMWKAKWEAKLQANPELLQKKIAGFETKLATMRERLGWLQDKAAKNSNPSLPHRIAHFQVKIGRVESRLAHLRSLSVPAKGVVALNQAPAPVAPIVNTYVAPVPTESNSSEEEKAPSELLKEAIQAKKEQMVAIRAQIKSGAYSRAEGAEKIFVIKEEITKLRDAHKEKMAAVRAQRKALKEAKQNKM